MRAVVDDHAGGLVVVGTTSSASYGGRFMDGNRPMRLRQAFGRSQPRQTCANDVDCTSVRQMHAAKQPTANTTCSRENAFAAASSRAIPCLRASGDRPHP